MYDVHHPGPYLPYPAPIVATPPSGRRPGFGASLTAWACNALAWLSYLVALFFGVWAFGSALAGDEAASTYGYIALGSYIAAAAAAVVALVALIVSFRRRLTAGELERSGPIADLVVLSVVSAISLTAVALPLTWLLTW